MSTGAFGRTSVSSDVCDAQVHALSPMSRSESESKHLLSAENGRESSPADVTDRASGSDAGGGEFSRSRGLSNFSATGMVLLTMSFTVSMPYAMAQAILLGGVMLIVLVSFIMAYMAVLVGRCWVVLMETWPERYRDQKVRRPYPAIAKEAGGRFWEITTVLSVDFTNFGAAVVLLLASASMAEILLPDHFSIRVWASFCTLPLLPLISFGTLMESRWLGLVSAPVSVLCTASIVIVLVISHVCTANTADTIPTVNVTHVQHSNTTTALWTMTSSTISHSTQTSSLATTFPADHRSSPVTFASFWLGMSTVVFALSPMSIVPTIHHDMRKPEQYGHVIVLAYTIGILMCLSTGVVGFETFGQLSHPNVLRNVQCRSSHTIWIASMVSSAATFVYFMCSVVLSLLPMTQHLEEALKMPLNNISIGHVLIRMGTLLAALAVAVAMPEFHKYASLLGASSMALNNFIFPPLFYYWITKATGRELHWAQLGFLLFVLVTGIVSGLAGTYAAIRNIIANSTPNPCHV
eukprot:scpid61959/ scgid0561/ Vacuolar amino acid transporter 1